MSGQEKVQAVGLITLIEILEYRSWRSREVQDSFFTDSSTVGIVFSRFRNTTVTVEKARKAWAYSHLKVLQQSGGTQRLSPPRYAGHVYYNRLRDAQCLGSSNTGADSGAYYATVHNADDACRE
jgi:hypothetical protein